jgi:glycosyltransferase involved in cell wall biosynthesis
MKVLIDGHMLGNGEGGNERYIENLTLYLKKEKELNTYILMNPSYKTRLNRYSRLIPLGVRNDILRLLSLPFLCNKYKIDILHTTYIATPIKKTLQVMTVHDLSFKRYPEFYSLRERFIFEILVPLSLRSADAIIVPSLFSKREFHYFYPHIARNKVHVTYEAANNYFIPVNKKEAQKNIAVKYGITKPFILTINSPNPKKNIRRVVQAFTRLKNKYTSMNLVIVGGRYNIPPNLKLINVLIIDYIPDSDLRDLYNSCEIFVYYSLYEGFGLPILEALSCHTPTITSSIEVHKEIAHNAVLYANSLDDKDLANKIDTLMRNKQLKKRLINVGAEVVKLYSWSKTAADTLKVYKEIYENRTDRN